MAYYTKGQSYEEHKVKNLGWVLRKASNTIITNVEIGKHNGTYGVGGTLKVFFDDGMIFYSDFADHSVLCNWIKSRRSWYGVTVHFKIYGQDMQHAVKLDKYTFDDKVR